MRPARVWWAFALASCSGCAAGGAVAEVTPPYGADGVASDGDEGVPIRDDSEEPADPEPPATTPGSAAPDAGDVQEDGSSDRDAGPSGPVDAGVDVEALDEVAHDCCPDGACLCHGAPPDALTAEPGPFATGELALALGTVSYPKDAPPPYASIALCGGFLNTGPEMAAWGAFYASHGFVTVVVKTEALDIPQLRAEKLRAALVQLADQHRDRRSPLFRRLALDRLGTSGYSMGGGGTTLASVADASLRTSVALAAWGAATSGVTVPTLFLCGSADETAPCTNSSDAYAGIGAETPRMMVTIADWTHFDWFGPKGQGSGTSGKYALAFHKVYLAGDQRWRSFLTSPVAGASITASLP